ncbi:hypothetical protein J7M22_13190, partial [Candidatus Poribacteria bacterium]|nr:hypothetical protein [Candidatus Poribacteria bacterium]
FLPLPFGVKVHLGNVTVLPDRAGAIPCHAYSPSENRSRRRPPTEVKAKVKVEILLNLNLNLNLFLRSPVCIGTP